MSDKTIVSLTEKEVANVLDALEEWLLFVGPKEVDADEEGLDDDRYNALVFKLREAQGGGK
jgi:hypothetical protein